MFSNHSRLIILAVAACLASPARAADDDFTAMFNGKDLKGWVIEGAKTSKDQEKKPIWTVEKGLLVASGKAYGWLRYDRPVKDFVFEVDYKLTQKGNSGVGVRCAKYNGKAETRPTASGYEIQLLDDAGKSATPKSSGSLYRYVAAKVNATLPTGKWNHIRVECRGPKILVTLNDKVIQDVDQSTIEEIKNKPLSGYISLQSHSNRVEFRNPRFKDL